MPETEWMTVHFKIRGDFVTDISRQIWCEGSYGKAMNILESIVGLTEHQRHQILEGKKRLEGMNELELLDDDATEYHGMPLKSVDDYLRWQEGEKEAAVEREKDLKAVIKIISGGGCYKKGSPWGLLECPDHVVTRSSGPSRGCSLIIDWDEFEERFPQLVSRAIAKQDIIRDAMVHAKCYTDDKDEVGPSTGLASLADSLVPGTGAMFEEPEVETGSYKDRNGWLLPNGTFYRCRYYQHNAVVEKLDKEVKDVESTWVRVQHPDDQPLETALGTKQAFSLYAISRLTQKQIDFMWDYCEHHKLPYPDDEIRGIKEGV